MKRMEFIQFIGTQRSGSNLLRLMLNEHPSISAPHPPHLVKIFSEILPNYGDLTDPDRRVHLATDMCQWVEANPVPWAGISLDARSIAKNSEDIYDIFLEIYRAKMRVDEGKISCCKSMANLYYVRTIEERIRPFYIYIYRDGRDVAASFQRAIVGDKHVYPLAKKWDEQQMLSLSFLEQLKPDRYEKVSYEQLIQDPEAILRRICEKLGIPFDSNMQAYYYSKESISTASSGAMWGNVSKPVISGNSGNFRQRLNQEEIDIFEQVAKDSLSLLGYSFVLNGSGRVPLEVAKYERLNQEAKTVAIRNALPADMEKRRAQKELLTEIATKFRLEDNH